VVGLAFEWLHDAYRQLRDIKPDEVHEALGADRRWPRLAFYDERGFRVLTVWARTHAGRPLIVAARPGSGLNWQCLGARDMTPAERLDFEAWEAGR
jgi:hypothetical protein